MFDLRSDYSKFIEDFYLGIQITGLILVLALHSLLNTGISVGQLVLVASTYFIYIVWKFTIYIKHLESRAYIDLFRKFIVKSIDGIFLGAVILLYRDVTDSLLSLVYVFLVIQSLRSGMEKRIYTTVYISILYIALLGVTKKGNLISIDVFIDIVIYFVLDYIIAMVMSHINTMHQQQKYYEEEIVNQNKKLEEIAFTDYLTSLNNHQAFYMYMDKMYKKTVMLKEGITLTIIDIDNFKIVNDTYGHLAGDEILREIAIIIKSNVRKTDFVARYGGEEFAIVHLDTNLQEGINIAEKLRAKVENHKFSFNNKHIAITVSMGTGSLMPEDRDIPYSQFIDGVDKLLYKAKNNGKNQVQHQRIVA